MTKEIKSETPRGEALPLGTDEDLKAKSLELEAPTPRSPNHPRSPALLFAAENMDWQQVVLNGGPPCFHLCEDGYFCGRAKAWEGHDSIHKFVSLAYRFETMIEEMRAMNDRWLKLHNMLATHPDEDWYEAPFDKLRALQRLKGVES